MCGIFGYIGKESNVALMAHKALCALIYRGYDSWGIVADTQSGFYIRKAVGDVSGVLPATFADYIGTQAIAHSRWATHGGVTEENAHPHFSHDRKIAVVHNGIVENHRALKDFLVKQFALPFEELFTSGTDTEVIPHLIDYFITKEKMSFEEAFVATAQKLDGRFAFVAMKEGEKYLLAVRDGSPLVVGKNHVGYFIASDIPAFLDHTRTVQYLDDRQFVRLANDDAIIRDLDTRAKVPPAYTEIKWAREEATKEGYPHFMIKEIMGQGHSLDLAIRQDDREMNEIVRLMKTHNVFPIGCGTAGKMARLAEIYLAEIGGIRAQSFVGSEFAPYRRFLDRKSLLFAVSQSGETADVLEALSAGKKQGAKVLSLLNVVGSTMARASDKALMLGIGPEIAVASTKAATAQIAVIYLLAYAAAGKLGEGKHNLRSLVKDVKAWLTPELSREIKSLAETLAKESDIYIIGRGINAPIAQEAAIKIQEVSYIHAEGFPGGELKHGPIALIRKGTPCIVLLPNDETRNDMESNATELKARGARIIGIAPDAHPLFDDWIQTPRAGDASPIVNIIPIQLLAYHLALLRGNDPDKPRNLAKSVTVK